MASEQQVQAVRGLFRDYSEEYFRPYLDGNSAWRGRNLQSCLNSFKDMVRLKSVIESCPLHAIPESEITGIVSAVENFRMQLMNASHVFENAPDPPSGMMAPRDQTLIDVAGTICEAVSHVAAACHGAVQLLNYADTYELKNKISTLYEKAEADLLEIEKIHTRIRDLAAAKTVNQFEKHFSKYGDELQGEVSLWLIATVALGGMTGLVIIALFFWQVTVFKNEFDTNGLILYVLSKVIFLALMIGATVWMGRNFKAAKHQLAITKHRAIALATFEVFPMSTTDPDIRSAILLETAKTVFGQTSTGYVDKESYLIDPTAIGSEAIKALTVKKDPS